MSLTRISFGSCSKQDRPQPLWRQILRRQPNVFVWGGDNVYHDRRTGLKFEPSPIERMRANYATQLAVPDYALVREHIPVIGTWDDHDFGLNDAGHEYENRSASQQLFLNFMDVPPGNARRRQEGVYSSHLMTTETGQLIKLILLDVRFHRTEYRPDWTGQMLGEQQW